MKFATVLRNSAEELPDAAELFTLYKHLKKSLKKIPCGEAEHDDSSLVGDPDLGTTASGDEDEGPTEALGLDPSLDPEALSANALDAAQALDDGERAFVLELTQDVAQLNEQYMEKEEVNVIRFGTLKDQAAEASTQQELQRAYRAVVDFHGELLLVLHWSILAYTGLVKILKKHHKRTGLLLRAPHLTNMLGQPFCSVEVTVAMVGSTEELVGRLARALGGEEGGASVAGLEVHHGSSLSAESPALGGGGAGGPPTERAGQLAGTKHDRCGEVVDGKASQSGGAGPPPPTSAEAPSPPPPPASRLASPPAQDTDRSVMRRTRAALGLWRQLQVTASSPSTVLPPGGGAAMVTGRMLSTGAGPAGSGLTNSSVA